MTSHTSFLGMVCAAAFSLVLANPCSAEQVAREQDILELRLGQRIMVDDGSCPAGQIKEVSGTKLSSAGVVRSVKCVSRPGAKR